MATVYSLFFGVLFTALCSINGACDTGVTTATRDQNALQDSLPLSTGDIMALMEPMKLRSLQRLQIVDIAHAELGVREATGRNDGRRVEEYLRYTHLGKGHAWCAAYVSWCYGEAGLSQPRNPWSPALFPDERTYWRQGKFLNRVENSIQPADIFGIYGRSARRINHVGLIKEQQGKYLVTLEGNSGDRVESRRRLLSTVYALADWIEE